MRSFVLLFLLLVGSAQAEVYKCVLQGKTTYTDAPCDAEALPAALPPVTTIRKTGSDDLVKSYDERLSREKKSRDASDAVFQKEQAQKAAREKAIRSAIIDHQVIEGMTASEVDSALGSADEALPNGTRRYSRNGQRTTVTFKEGLVSGISITTERRKK